MNKNELSLDQHEQAMQLHQRIMTSGTLAAQNIWDMANALKEMRDGKLYKELGYDRFDLYCENEVGMKRRNAYNYISIVENIKPENVQTFAHFGASKLSLLASLSEEKQQELTEKVDIESTSVRELKEEINKLKGEKLIAEHEREKLTAQLAAETARSEEIEKKLTEESDINEGLRQELEKSDKRLIESRDEIIKLADEHIKLAKENKELKERPVEVAVVDHTEEYEKKLAAAIEDERRKNDEQTMELTKDFQARFKAQRDEYEEKLKAAANAEKQAAAPAYDKEKETFKIYLVTAHDAIKRLIEAAKVHDEVYSDKVKQLLIKSIELLEVQQ